MHALAAICALLSAACGVVAIVVRVKQWRAAKATRADIDRENIVDAPGDGTVKFNHEHLNSLLHQLAHNQIPYVVEIGFLVAAVVFAIAAAGLTLFAALW